jgi:hypothetical protein
MYHDPNFDWIAHYKGVKARLNRPAPKPQPAITQPVEVAPPVAPVELPVNELVAAFRLVQSKDGLAREIIRDCAAEGNFPIRLLSSDYRNRHIVRLRQKAMYRMHRELGWSLPRIGRMLNRDHTTVLHGVRRHEFNLICAEKGIKPTDAGFRVYIGRAA